VLAVGDVQKVLQNLLRENVTIRNAEAVLEALADAGAPTRIRRISRRVVRQRLGPRSASRSCRMRARCTCSRSTRRSSRASRRASAPSRRQTAFVVEPKFAEQVMARLSAQAERMMKSNLLPVLLCSPDLRRHVRALSERVMPHLRVISVAEIPNNIDLKSFGTVSL
jgi:flagellar biosynthesis protein FlhA